MAGETFYFVVSIGLTIAAALRLTNIIWVRSTGHTILGQKHKPNTPRYKYLEKYAGLRNISITAAVTLLLAINLVFDIHHILQIRNHNAVAFILIYAPSFAIIMLVFGMISARSKLSKFDKER